MLKREADVCTNQGFSWKITCRAVQIINESHVLVKWGDWDAELCKVRLTGRPAFPRQRDRLGKGRHNLTYFQFPSLYFSLRSWNSFFYPRPFPQGQFSFMSLLAFQSIFCCYLLFWSLSLCRLTHWIHSCFWYYPSWMTFSNQFNVSRVQHGSLTSIIFKLPVIFRYTYKNKPNGRVGCFQRCRRPTCFFKIRTTLHIRFKTSLWKSLPFFLKIISLCYLQLAQTSNL